MNPTTSTTSLNPLLTSDSTNPGEAYSEGKLNNYAVSKSDSGNLNSTQGLEAVVSTSKPLESRTVTNPAGAKIVSDIIDHMNELKDILIENYEHDKAKGRSPDIEVFENATKLLNHLDPDKISQGKKVNDGRSASRHCDGYSNTYYKVYYNDDLLFTVIETACEERFYDDNGLVGCSGAIEITGLFDQLYFAPEAPGYESVKSEFEENAKLQNS